MQPYWISTETLSVLFDLIEYASDDSLDTCLCLIATNTLLALLLTSLGMASLGQKPTSLELYVCQAAKRVAEYISLFTPVNGLPTPGFVLLTPVVRYLQHRHQQQVLCSLSLIHTDLCLQIQTTFERVHLFGLYILPHLVVKGKYKQILLKSNRCIARFYYKNPTTCQTIIRLSITSDGTSPLDTALILQYATCDFPSPLIAGPNAGLFLLVVVLSDLKRVELCYVASRCTRLLIHYINGLSVVLRQQYTSCDLRRLYVYNTSGLSVNNICFRMAKY